MESFRNVPYPYATADDTFDAKGYHLNVLVEEINNLGSSTYDKNIPNNSSEAIIIGDKNTDRAYFIDYTVVRGSLYEAGTVSVIYKEGTFAFSHKSIGDNSGVTFSFSVSADNIIIIATTSNATDAAALKLKTKTIKK